IYRDTPNELRTQILDDWRSGVSFPVIAATTTLSCGIDVPNVRLVIHYGAPYSLLEFIQQSGRGGRDGKLSSTSIILYNRYFSPTPDEADSKALKEYLTTKDCRRKPLSEYIDGVVFDCRMGNDTAKCDNCLKKDESLLTVPDYLTVGDAFNEQRAVSAA